MEQEVTSQTLPSQTLPSITNNELSVLLITLLKGVLYRDEKEKIWQSLLSLQLEINQFIAVLELELVVFENEGFAWLKQKEQQEDSLAKGVEVPKLIVKRPLSYNLSLLLVTLRKRLLEFDAQSAENRLVLNFEEILELMQTYLPTGSNEAKFRDQLETQLKRATEMGFVRVLKKSKVLQNSAEVIPDVYEIRRIIIAFINSQWLDEFESKLTEYINFAKENN